MHPLSHLGSFAFPYPLFVFVKSYDVSAPMDSSTGECVDYRVEGTKVDRARYRLYNARSALRTSEPGWWWLFVRTEIREYLEVDLGLLLWAGIPHAGAA